MKPLVKEFHYYLKNQDTLAKQYKSKFIVIKANQVIGVYDNENQAIIKTMEEHELGTFLVHLAEAGEENVSKTFHSRILLNARR